MTPARKPPPGGVIGSSRAGRATEPASLPAERLRARVAQLREQIEYHNRLYYEADEPEIGDDEYDALIDELRRIEAEHPQLRTP